MSRMVKSARTLVSGYSLTLIGMVIGLVVTPWVVAAAGDEGYGAFRVTIDYIGYLMLLELGMGGAVQAGVARAIGQNAPERLVQVLRAGARYFVWVSCAAFAGSVVLIVVIDHLVPTQPDVTAALRLGIGLSLVGWFLLPLSVYRQFCDARQRGYVGHLSLFVSSILISGCSVIFLEAGLGIAGLFLAILVGNLASTAIVVYDARRVAPLWQVLFGPIDPAVRGELSKLNWWTFLFNICGRFAILSDSIIIALMVNTAAVTPFLMTTRLPSMLGTQLLALGGSSWAALAELHYQGHTERMNTRLIQLTRLSSFAGFVLLAPAAVWNEAFVTVWAGDGQYASGWITIVSCANAWMMSLNSLWGWVLSGTGRVKTMIPCMVVGTVVNVIGSLVGTSFLGVVGPLVGTSLQLFFVSAWWSPLVLRREFGTSVRELLLATVWPVVYSAPAVVLMVVSQPWIPIMSGDLPRWGRLLLVLAIIGGWVGVLMVQGWFLVLARNERTAAKQWLARLRGRA